MLEEARRRRGDLEFFLQRLRQRRPAVFERQRRAGGEAETADNCLDESGIVARRNAKRVARLEAEAGAFERNLDMPRLLARAAAGEDEIVDDASHGTGLRLSKAAGFGLGDRRRGGVGLPRRRWCDRAPGSASASPIQAPAAVVIIDVAIDARQQPRRAKLLETPVEPLAGLAELFIGRVAKRQHGEADAGQRGRLAAFDEFEEFRSPAAADRPRHRCWRR